MKVNIIGKNISVTQGIASKVEKKLEILNKYFIIDQETLASVLIRTYPHSQKIEVTIPTKVATLRAEVIDTDLYNAIDKVVDKLEDQIRRQKTRLQDKHKEALSSVFIESNLESENEELVRTKSIEPQIMSLDEAIMKMELLDHNFFIYTDDETNKIAVVYRRKAGGYGCIETE